MSKTLLLNILTFVVAAFHIGFFILERFLINQPIGQKIFKVSSEHLPLIKVWAANQAVYNLVLAIGLILSLVKSESPSWLAIRFFILTMIIVVGIYGAITVGKSVFFIQSLPALIALFLLISVLATPRMNDITTDPNSPVSFLIDEKPYPKQNAALQYKYYVTINPLALPLSKSKAYELVKTTIREKNWTILKESDQEMKIQAQQTSTFFRFKDDMVIAVQGDNEKAIIQMRSKSQSGKSDFGVNAHRIVDFFEDLQRRYKLAR